jgi:hypothetical protein
MAEIQKVQEKVVEILRKHIDEDDFYNDETKADWN